MADVDPTRDYIQSAGEVNDGEGVIVPTEHHANASAEDIKKDHNILHTVAVTEADNDGRAPTDEEKATLRHVSAPILWSSYVVCVVELAERASYYGVSGVFTNFIQRPLPAGGNGAGAPAAGTQASAGALGLGLQTATALVTLFNFLAYVTPMLGGMIADMKLGRLKTLWWGILFGFVGHVLLVIAAIPDVISEGHAIAAFIIGMLILAFATGFIKPCIAPIIADQCPIKTQQVKTLKSGEKVIVDPKVTVETMLHLYYWAVNIGAFFSIATTYSEKRIGFWLAYLTPGIFYLIMPIGLLWVQSRLILYPPKGAETLDAFKAVKVMWARAGVVTGFKGGDALWDQAKPSVIAQDESPKASSLLAKIKWDDKFVDDLRVTVIACKIFLFQPIWALADGGLNSIITNMAGSMTTNGLPNDLLSNFNPISTVVTIPIYNYWLYPTLRKLGFNFSPVRRICVGYLFGVVIMIISAILQWQVYETSPCGYHATECAVGSGVSPISAWAVLPIYWLQPMGGILISVTSYEMAYNLTPANMKGLVIAIVFLMSALSSAIVEICSPAFNDPNLIWPFVGIGAANLLAAIANYWFFRDVGAGEVDLSNMETQRQAVTKADAEAAVVEKKLADA
ncbi:PTR2-domain-containing protein [Schizophyllum commune H4-8]|nr:PTR2-domain-containing protein [Schizophyllum commune H4-8]KAI5889083.1 PTR2-domain-containing protein [Schizophyllum commune H4-8]